MMVLVDTSVWIDHFRSADQKLSELLVDNLVLGHPMVTGELACGSLRQRDEILPLLKLLPQAGSVEFEEMLEFIENRRLYAVGLGWVDAMLLASALTSNAQIWTKDKNLIRAAKSLKINFH
ncbi:MAG: hypothetical protein RIQ81_1505 [Pseudomonadota bacterium]|jgi:predicted nucleic acid-binding protein